MNIIRSNRKKCIENFVFIFLLQVSCHRELKLKYDFFYNTVITIL